MPVFALWSAPRALSTACFRSMVERGDVIALHEPFCNLADFGETDRAWGIYSGYFHDLDGHLWEVMWNPQLDPER